MTRRTDSLRFARSGAAAVAHIGAAMGIVGALAAQEPVALCARVGAELVVACEAELLHRDAASAQELGAVDMGDRVQHVAPARSSPRFAVAVGADVVVLAVPSHR